MPRARSLNSFACAVRVPFYGKEKLSVRARQAGQGSQGANRIRSGTTGPHRQCQAGLAFGASELKRLVTDTVQALPLSPV